MVITIRTDSDNEQKISAHSVLSTGVKSDNCPESSDLRTVLDCEVSGPKKNEESDVLGSENFSTVPAGTSLFFARLWEKMRVERADLLVHMEALARDRIGDQANRSEGFTLTPETESQDNTSQDPQVILQIEANARDMLDKIERAMKKLRQSAYGLCTSCSQMMTETRLEALPYAELCVSCQEKREKLYY